MKSVNVKRMAGVALLMAMVVVMQFLSGIIPPVGGFSFSLVLIPIVLGAALFGPKTGALLGGTFGAVVFINCVTGADPGGQMVLQANPVLCFLVVMGKGILAGLLSGLVYKVMKSKDSKGYISMVCAAVACPVVNTGVFIVCMLTFFRPVLEAWAQDGGVAAFILSGLVLVNFVPELIINVVFSPASQRIIESVSKKK